MVRFCAGCLAIALTTMTLAGCRNPPRDPAMLTPAAIPPPVAPATSTVLPTATPIPSPTPVVVIHVVQAGDTLLGIALQYGVTVEEIAAANDITDPTSLQIGQELRIPLPSTP